ncbi:MAG: C10 family peptidase [Bacteroidales bacterium]|nr:C10 family peptidase [Bacteroidales bacterium]
MRTYLPIGLLLLVSVSCTKDVVVINQQTETSAAVKSTENVPQTVAHNAGYVVSIESARFFANSLYPKDIITSEEMMMEGGDALYYLFNFQDSGWIIVSSDTRTDPVLASQQCGFFSFDEIDNFGMRVLLDSFKAMILTLRNSSDEPKDSLTAMMWNRIERKISIRSSDNLNVKTKGYYDENGNYNNGPYWVRELVSFTPGKNYITNIEHLIPTKLGQSFPWNVKSVYYVSNTNAIFHAMVGCVPVAEGQIMYYLHNTVGKPNGLYHDVYAIEKSALQYSSVTYDSSDIVYSNYVSNSDRWNYMPLSNSLPGNWIYTSDFLTALGHDLNVSYGLEGSYATVSMPGFAAYGISCSYASVYSKNLVTAELSNNMPVYVEAAPSLYASVGHAFVIDSWQQYYRTYSYTYQWTLVYDGEDVVLDNDLYFDYNTGVELNPNGDRYTYDYYENGYLMDTMMVNWGYNGQDDDVAFSADSFSPTYQNTVYSHPYTFLYNFQ